MVRCLIALWRATLLSVAIFVALEGATYLAFQESPLAWLYQAVARLAVGLEWLPYQVGKLIPTLHVPNDLAVLCGFKRLALPSVLINPNGLTATPYTMIGNFPLEWPEFRQHMLGSTVTYFILFLAASVLRRRWRAGRQALSVR